MSSLITQNYIFSDDEPQVNDNILMVVIDVDQHQRCYGSGHSVNNKAA